MILKKADDKLAALTLLKEVLATAPEEKRPLIQQELRFLNAGMRAEADAAYLIDFDLAKCKETAVIHDLRLTLPDGRVAQIDHLLIHESGVFYVLETKSVASTLKITNDGEFLRWNDYKQIYEGMPSPLKQNERHVTVLHHLLKTFYSTEPEIRPYVLVSSNASVMRGEEFNSSRVVKADQFVDMYRRDLVNVSMRRGPWRTLFGGSKYGSAEDVGRWLCGCHKPITIDYRAKFSV